MNYTYSIILGISLLIIVLYYYKKYYKSIKGFEDGVTLFRHCDYNDEIKHGFSTQIKIDWVIESIKSILSFPINFIRIFDNIEYSYKN